MQSVRLLVANLKCSLSVKCGGLFCWLATVSFLSLLSVNAQLGGDISFTSGKFEVGEGDGNALITLTRNNEWGIALVDVIVEDGTATNGVQFTCAKTNTLIFSNLQTRAQFTIAIAQNSATNTGGAASVTAKLKLANARAATNQPSIITPKIAAVNATADLSILDEDALYKFNIEKTWYQVGEVGGSVNVVVKLAGAPGDKATDVAVDYEVKTDSGPTKAGSDYATAGDDYEAQTGTLTFGANDTTQTITINISPDQKIEFNEDFHVVLTAARGKITPDPDPNSTNTPPDITFALGPIVKATVTILFNGSTTHPQPAGAVDLLWNADNSKTTQPPFNLSPGANNTVFAIATMPDGTNYIGGEFTSVDSISRIRIARLTATGEVDPTFEALGGANDFVTAVAAYTAPGPNRRKVLIGGGFTAVNGVQRNGIARLNTDGSIDTTFNPGNGANGPVYSVALQLDGTILIGGDFTSFDGILVNRIARLLADGQLDLNYQTGLGPDGPVFSVVSQSLPPVIVQAGRTNGPTDMFTRTVNAGANSGIISLSFTFVETNDFTVIYGGQPIYFSDLTNHLVVLTNADGTTTNTIRAHSYVISPFSGFEQHDFLYHKQSDERGQ